MLTLKKVAITGKPGSGKSTVSQILKEFGGYIVDTDEITHELLLSDASLNKKIFAIFGSKIFLNGVIQKDLLAEIVFQDLGALRKLENLLHPLILKKIDEEFEKAKITSVPFFIVQVPLLYEVDWEKYFDLVILVTCKDEVAKKRNELQKDWEKRNARFFPDEQKSKRADIVIDNTQNIASLKNQINQILPRLY